MRYKSEGGKNESTDAIVGDLWYRQITDGIYLYAEEENDIIRL